MCGDVAAEQIPALTGVEIDDFHSAFPQPVDATLKRARLAHDHRADLELHDEPAAVPARRKRGDHDGVAVAALPSGLAEGVGLAVHGRVALLHAAIVAAA